jgi:thioester reductase-like protein
MTAILLTGATGSLGGHLAAALLDQAQGHPVIYCLVRADDPPAASRRLRERMAEIGIDDSERLVAVPANIERPGLGMSPGGWNDLADQVSEIYHCAASVHLTAAYQRLAPANVGGTRELIELAATIAERSHSTVGFHFVSTLAVFLDAARAGFSQVDETTPPSMETAGPLGYPRTKVAAERALARASDRGVIGTIYRPGLVTGHSVTGDTSTSDLLMPLLRAAVAVGSAPDQAEAVPMEAADLVARYITHLATGHSGSAVGHPGRATGQPGGHAYHLVEPHPIPLTYGFDALRRAGFPLDPVPSDIWWELAAERGDHPDIAPLIRMGSVGRRMLGLEPAYPPPPVRSDHTWAALRRAIPQPTLLDEEFFDRLIACGFNRAMPHLVPV